MRTIKLFAVVLLVVVAAATALAYGPAGVAARITTVAAHTSVTTEPLVLLLSGSMLLGLAGVVRRFVF